MAKVGVVEYPNADILPFRPIAAPNAPNSCIAGEIVRSNPNYGLLQDDCKNGDVRGLTNNSIIRVKKTAAAIPDNAYVTLIANADGAKNDYWVRAAVATEPIHGINLELAPLNTTDTLIHLYRAPYAIL